MPVTHGVTGSSPVRTAILKAIFRKLVIMNLLQAFFIVFLPDGKSGSILKTGWFLFYANMESILKY